VWVGSDGYLTFGQGDYVWYESVYWFNAMPRISPFFDDLIGRNTGAVYVNDQLPGRFVVTWYHMQHYNYGGSNTIQATLFSDGRIQFAYNGISATFSGTIVGITPGNVPVQSFDYSHQTNFDAPPSNGIYEYFYYPNYFDLDQAFIVYTRRGEGGYSVRTILPAPTSSTTTINGSPSTASSTGTVSASSVNAQANGAIGNAEVEVLSSGNVNYRGLTNTDGRGNFTLSGVPVGGISVTVRRKGKDLGYGGLVVRGKSDNTHVDIHPPRPDKKQEAPNQ